MAVLSSKPVTRPAGDVDLARVLKIQVPLIVKLAERKLHVRDILRLNIGTILEFDKNSEDQLELLVNNRRIGEGETVKVGENFGLRVTKISSPKERAEAMSA